MGKNDTSSEREPVVRRGQKKPFRKCTARELKRRIDIVESWLREEGSVHKYELRKRIKDRFDIEWRHADDYIAEAKRRLLMSLNQSAENHRADSLLLYESICADPNASHADRIRARRSIDKLLGICTPEKLKLEHSGGIAHEERAEVEDLELDIATKRKVLRAMRARKQTEDEEDD